MPLLLVTTAHPSLYEHQLDGELHPNLGRLVQPRHYSSIEATAAAGIPWAADNDCFQGLDAPAYERMLERLAGLPGCLFVTVPDTVAEAGLTDLSFEEYGPLVHMHGLPVAYVAQDEGVEYESRGIPWGAIDALFMGGSTEWKESRAALDLSLEAHRRGLWVHWGRVNTKRRLDLIVEDGWADSFDGSSFAQWRTANLNRGLEWARTAGSQLRLALA